MSRALCLGAVSNGRKGTAMADAFDHVKAVWQLLQSRVVTIWVACLPVAVMPLWQDWQEAMIPT